VPADCSAAKLQRECVGDFFALYIRGGALPRLRVRCSVGALYLDAWVKRALIRRVDGVTAVSQSLLDIYARAGRVRSATGHVVYNLPPPPAQAAPDRTRSLADFGLPDRPLVLYVGKRSPGKGFPILVEAARITAARMPEACFVVVGEGPPDSRLGDDNLRLLGGRSHADVERLYALADVVVHPAVWPEPFSRVPLEAAAFGKPVVGTRIGGMPEAVEDERTGLLVDRSDPQALAKAVLRLLRDADLRRSLGERAAVMVGRTFSADRVVEDLLRTYRSARG
jgi:glycosyltransferase involved in cell wall biosynthesis